MKEYKITADALYDLVRYASKNGIFDENPAKTEINNIFYGMRKDFEENSINKSNLTYSIKIDKLGM